MRSQFPSASRRSAAADALAALGTRFSGLPLEVRQTRVPLAMSRASSYPPMACTQTGASAVAASFRRAADQSEPVQVTAVTAAGR
jgi:hypothetical protein